MASIGFCSFFVLFLFTFRPKPFFPSVYFFFHPSLSFPCFSLFNFTFDIYFFLHAALYLSFSLRFMLSFCFFLPSFSLLFFFAMCCFKFHFFFPSFYLFFAFRLFLILSLLDSFPKPISSKCLCLPITVKGKGGSQDNITSAYWTYVVSVKVLFPGFDGSLSASNTSEDKWTQIKVSGETRACGKESK